MENSMTPSAMTDGQIDKACDIFRSALRKHRAEFGSNFVQQVLGMSDFGEASIAPFRTRVEAVSNMIVRTVQVNRTRTGTEAIKATGRVFYGNVDVVASMPNGEVEDVTLYFVNFGRALTPSELDAEVAKLGDYQLADPFAAAAQNEADPAFADKYPNGTQWWKDRKACYAVFDRWDGERLMDVDQHSHGWLDDWWFPLVRK